MVHKAQPVDGKRQKQADIQSRIEGVKASVEKDALVILGFLVEKQDDWRPEIKTFGDGRVVRVKVEMDDN